MPMMKISASFTPWDGRPHLGYRHAICYCLVCHRIVMSLSCYAVCI